MYLAVKLWKDTANKPAGMPDSWPSEVKELGSSRILPSSEWILMTKKDYQRYLEIRRDLYNQWNVMQDRTTSWNDPDVPSEP